MELLTLTPEGRILLTLKHGSHTYAELKLESGLSDRWLTIKLGQLEDSGLVKKSGKRYQLSEGLNVSAYELGGYMSFQARHLARELAELGSVSAIVLFGGVARRNAHEYSDLDLIVVMNGPVENVKEAIWSKISELEFKYHVTVDPLVLTWEDFLDNAYSREGGIIYGVAEGYEVLVDKTGAVARLLRETVEEIKRSHDYLKEVRIWLKAR